MLSNSFFCHNIFKSSLLQMHLQVGKVNPFPHTTADDFQSYGEQIWNILPLLKLRLEYSTVENIVTKGEIAH